MIKTNEEIIPRKPLVKLLIPIRVLLLTTGVIGCIGDKTVAVEQSESKVPQPDAGKGTESTPKEDECVIVMPRDAGEPPVPLTKLRLDESHYEGWDKGDDDYGPEGDPIQCDETHVGYLEARCWDCHAVGSRYEPEDHDPRMQYWAWSCARGFPGSECHGHGYNGCYGFNHANDSSFAYCTRKDCHTQYKGERWYENHAMDKAPVPFCNACHDFFWEGWPEDEELYELVDF